jgi:hypothetical protein
MWNLPADLDSNPRWQKKRMYDAARQRFKRAKPSPPRPPLDPAIAALLADLPDLEPKLQALKIVTLSREEVQDRKEKWDAFLAVNGRSQRKLRPHRNRIFAGWLEAAKFQKLRGRDPSGSEFAKLRKLTRNSALALLRRIRELEKPGMPWA